jgi:hypothetical protein
LELWAGPVGADAGDAFGFRLWLCHFCCFVCKMCVCVCVYKSLVC